MSKSIAYSLGVYLAEFIIDNRMPSLSCQQWTRNPIQVTWGEAKELKRLESIWFSKRQLEERKIIKGARGAEILKKEKEAHKASEDEWNALMKYRYTLIAKYLPHTLRCRVPHIDFSNEEINDTIKKGLIEALWDSDHCQYSLKDEDITLENEVDTYGDNDEYTMKHTYVTLKLDLERPATYTGEDWIEIDEIC